MICQAFKCRNEAMPGHDLCGVCDEDREDGAIIRLKPGSKVGSTKPNPNKTQLKAQVKEAVAFARMMAIARIERGRASHARWIARKAAGLIPRLDLEVIHEVRAKRAERKANANQNG